MFLKYSFSGFISLNGLTDISFTERFFAVSFSLQHHICLHDSGDHGDASHQHNWGGGAHVLRPGAGMVQRHVLRTRLPDAWAFHHHDPEGVRHKQIWAIHTHPDTSLQMGRTVRILFSPSGLFA